MSWAIVAGAGVGLVGTMMAGDAAEQNADANRSEQRRLYEQQYGSQNNARGRMAGELYGSGAMDYLRSGGRDDFDRQFGSGAWNFLNMTPEQQTAVRAGRQAPGAINPNNQLANEFNNSYQPPNQFGWGGWGAGNAPTAEERAAQREQAFGRFIQQRTGKAPTNEELNAFRNNQQLPVPGNSDYNPEALDAYQKQYGNKRGAFDQMGDQAAQAEREGNAQLDNYVANTDHLQGMFRNTLSDYDSASTGLINDQTRRGQGLESMAAQWGQGQDKLLNEDAQRLLAGANQTAQARLAAAGMGNSTLVGNQLSSNAMEVGRDLTRSKAQLAAAQLDRTMGARSQNNSAMGALQQSRATGRTGLQTGNIDFMNQRLTGGSAMGQDTLNRNIGLRQRPLDTRLAMLGSPLMNPGTNIQSANFYSPSGDGLAQSAFGGYLGGMGGRMFAGGYGGQQQGGGNQGGQGSAVNTGLSNYSTGSGSSSFNGNYNYLNGGG